MDLKLRKKVTNPTIIEGFPGFGFVGTVTTEFLINHLKGEMIGEYWFEDAQASVTIHEGRVIKPVEIFYSKKYNLIIVHSITLATGIEWISADVINDIARKTNAKEIISVEGVGTMTQEVNENPEVFYYASDKKYADKLKKIGVNPLKEGIIMGVTSAVLLKSKTPITCLFAETYSNMPDSNAAAKVIEILDKYLGLAVDTKPLLKQAEQVEAKVKELIEKGNAASKEMEKKQLSYVG